MFNKAPNGGTKDAPAPSTATLSDPNEAPLEDTRKEKKGDAAPGNVNLSIDLFLDSNESDDDKSAVTEINTTQIQIRRRGIETKFASWHNKCVKRKVRTMAAETTLLKLALREDNDNPVLSKKNVGESSPAKPGKQPKKGKATANKEMITGI